MCMKKLKPALKECALLNEGFEVKVVQPVKDQGCNRASPKKEQKTGGGVSTRDLGDGRQLTRKVKKRGGRERGRDHNPRWRRGSTICSTISLVAHGNDPEEWVSPKHTTSDWSSDCPDIDPSLSSSLWRFAAIAIGHLHPKLLGVIPKSWAG